MYKVIVTSVAKKDAINIECSGLRSQVDKIISTVTTNPFENSQSFKELKGRLRGKYFRRINKEHRFVYEVLPNINAELD